MREELTPLGSHLHHLNGAAQPEEVYLNRKVGVLPTIMDYSE